MLADISHSHDADPDHASAIRARYTAGARTREPGLCCPTAYDPAYLAPIPAEILECDYGCGDPSKYLQSDDIVLDLGSGSGKTCYVAAQVVGPGGRIIGIDENAEMLALARRHRAEVAARLGYSNVVFKRARIEDLRLDLDLIDEYLAAGPISSSMALAAFEARLQRMRTHQPLIADDSIGVVISNCVLNLVPDGRKPALLREVHRVLKSGGRAILSDIVSDEDVPPQLKADPQLWSGCVAGAVREDRFLAAFEDAGFHGITMLDRSARPWVTVAGIEFRSVTIAAWKGDDRPCLDHGQAVIYRGPFRSVTDDDGHLLRRGERTAVCGRTFERLGAAPYAEHFERIGPEEEIDDEDAPPFDCDRPRVRDPRETKRSTTTGANRAQEVGGGCGPGCC